MIAPAKILQYLLDQNRPYSAGNQAKPFPFLPSLPLSLSG